ncbi:MAG: hypothetical protein Q7K65_02990 [Candidatus Buchananbacteria bacterium]|nr:hypothetical protein [Candidatus Buchananbacteria bacterium]
MWYKIIIYTILMALLATVQITLFGSFGDYFNSFNFLLAALVILLFLVDFKWIVYFTILSGLILDIYSSLPFGIFLLSFFSAVSISDFLLSNFFTNRSFYSVIFLGLSAVLSFNLVFLITSGLFYLLGISDFYIDQGYWWKLFYQIINISLVLSALFFIINSVSRKFKPNFIRS